MPLKKILFKPGVNRENTRYTTEGGWYDCDKVRFRQGTPEKIGGWNPLTATTFLGVCRSLWAWSTLDGVKLMGVGTNLKFYIQRGGAYYDITPLRGTATLTNPFTATNGSAVITVTDVAHGAIDGDFVTFSGATGLGGNITAAVLNREYQIDFVDLDTYRITATATANATDASGSPGGGTVSAAYQINTGPANATPISGWGASAWGNGDWGEGDISSDPLRLWTQVNFGENLVFGPRGGGLYYWTAASGVNSRGVALSSIGDAETPTVQNAIAVSDASRFVFAFGCDDYGSVNQDRMLSVGLTKKTRPFGTPLLQTKQVASDCRMAPRSLPTCKPAKRFWCGQTHRCTLCSTLGRLMCGAPSCWETTSPSSVRTLLPLLPV